MGRFSQVFWVAAAVGVAFAIRCVFGLQVLKELLPYLIAGPTAYGILRVFYFVRRTRRAAKTPADRAKEIYAGILIVALLVLISVAPFQQWMDADLWTLLASLAVIVLILGPQLIHNRATRGTWLAKRPLPPKRSPDGPSPPA